MSQLKIVENLKLAKALLTLLRDPEKTESVFDISDNKLSKKAYEITLKMAKSVPGAPALFSERYCPADYDLDELSNLPEGSLGQVYAAHMKKNNLSPTFYRKPQIRTDEDYLKYRVRQTHDIWHVVTNYDTSVRGETALQAFMLAQIQSPLSAVLVGGSFMRIIFSKPEQIPELMNTLIDGWVRGRNAKPFFAQKWEEQWTKPLTQWRQELGV